MMRIGGKSAAFINHKPFHPGNRQNMEKKWIAEQKKEREEREQKARLEVREKEMKIERLRMAMRLREAEEQLANADPELIKRLEKKLHGGEEAQQRKKFHRPNPQAQSSSDKSAPVPRVRSKYAEDVHPQNHSSVWGSWFDRETSSWGYSCCKQTVRSEPCSASSEPAGDHERGEKRRAQGDGECRKKRKEGGSAKGAGSGGNSSGSRETGLADLVQLLHDEDD
uniref:Pre-mRNA-splicing factor SLU7 n=1 Tax=Chromera velia CCMP2878 TaxID=1169474 RepID=A0A0G4F4V1_9ALVE|eukprot:Cvel_15154.t1-p1 / transcript=Cvel_15154.t1 / gene=Cvel_15154 / organism=Chromera_velia_CCMP2878 / gene_product=Pre-mRNA-splicing factor SLU7, putative / transcript_product=Pre-mRNA-splicing factor SLU7, putative / location=Cvel_scaffold1106:41406-42074(+) / protein_length=223 / sequence_SO=supercontig / SO=protein_coding / is_pseudo=false